MTDRPDSAANAIEMSRPFDLSELREGPEVHAGEASEAEREALARRFDVLGIDALRYRLATKPWRGGIMVEGHVEGSVTQECVVTLEPIRSRIDERFVRGFLDPAILYADHGPGSEIEIIDDSELDDLVEPWTDPLDLGEIAAESFGLALDPYPRDPNLEPVTRSAIPKDAEPIVDAEEKPFAALGALRNRLAKDDEDN